MDDVKFTLFLSNNALVSSSSWGLEGLRFVIVALPGLFSYPFLGHFEQLYSFKR